MTRRERIEARLQKRREWAASREAKAARAFNAAHRIADNIPLGQPILVGHHSEKRARRDQERIRSNMDKGCESQRMAAEHDSKADNIEHALDRSIFDDDPDAVEQLEARIAALSAKADRMTALNKAIRRELKKGAGWLDRVGATEQEKRALLANATYDYRHQPMFPPYAMSNIRGRIAKDRERLKTVKARQARQARAEAGGGILIERPEGSEYCLVTFTEKPAQEVLDALKAAGFWWSKGSWAGKAEALPEVLK